MADGVACGRRAAAHAGRRCYPAGRLAVERRVAGSPSQRPPVARPRRVPRPPATSALDLGPRRLQRARPRPSALAASPAAPRPPAHDDTISPRAGIVPSAACAARSPSDPRTICSWSFVSSRQTAPRPVGAAGRRRGRAGSRRAASAPRTGRSPARRPRSRASRSRRSRPVRGRNPSNDQRGPASPAAATAASTADAPGTGTTAPPCAGPRRDQPLARVADTTGVPASVTSARSVAGREVLEERALPRRAALRVVAHRPGRDLVAVEQPARDPRVLGRDERHRPQDLERAERDVAEVADRRRDDVQRPGRPPGRPLRRAQEPRPAARVEVVDAGRPRARASRSAGPGA